MTGAVDTAVLLVPDGWEIADVWFTCTELRRNWPRALVVPLRLSVESPATVHAWLDRAARVPRVVVVVPEEDRSDPEIHQTEQRARREGCRVLLWSGTAIVRDETLRLCPRQIEATAP